ncbi:hypothetical protein [Anaerotignum sp.]
MAYGEKQNEMIEWLANQGVVPCDGGTDCPLILSCIGEVATVFPDLFDSLSDCYFYRQEEQQYEGGTTDDAVFWYHTPSDGVTLYAIGLSTVAAAEGENYLLLCLLHELAHLKNLIENGQSSHRASFHGVLNELIRKFNESTGRNIENDFNGLQMRHDSKAWVLPNNIPTQTRKQGQEFRHG